MSTFRKLFERAIKEFGNDKRAHEFYRQTVVRLQNTETEQRDLYYALLMSVWFGHEPKERRVFKISQSGEDMTALFSSLADVNLEEYKKEFEQKYGKYEKTFGCSFVIEFETPVDMSFLFTKGLIEGEFPPGQLLVKELFVFNDMAMVDTANYHEDQHVMLFLISEYFVKLFIYFKLEKFSVVKTEKTTTTHYSVQKKPNLKKKTMKWRYFDFTVTKKEFQKPKSSRPFSFEGKKEVVKVRKDHFRRLRNGEVRFFTGMSAKYYVKEEDQTLGTIVKI